MSEEEGIGLFDQFSWRLDLHRWFREGRARGAECLPKASKHHLVILE